MNLTENMQAHALPQGLLSFRFFGRASNSASSFRIKQKIETDSWKWRRIKTILFAMRKITFIEKGRDK